MDIILLQKVANLGQIGDRVKVKSGYARNFLVPTGRATMATAANIAKFEEQRHILEAKAGQELAAAQARALKFENFKLTITAKSGAEGKLFGSIGTADIAEASIGAGQPINTCNRRCRCVACLRSSPRVTRVTPCSASSWVTHRW